MSVERPRLFNKVINYGLGLIPSRERSKLGQFLISAGLTFFGYPLESDFKHSGEERLISLLKNQLNGLSLDVGANSGNFSKMLLSQTQGSVLAIEASRSHLNSLQAVKETFGERFDFSLTGAGSKKSSFLYSDRIGSTIATEIEAVASVPFFPDLLSKEEISLKPIKEIFQNSIFNSSSVSIDLIKVDVEGSEFEVLKSSARFLKSKRVRHILFESNIHSVYTGNNVFRIASLFPGYSLEIVTPWGLVEVERDHPSANMFRYSNFLLTRREDL